MTQSLSKNEKAVLFGLVAVIAGGAILLNKVQFFKMTEAAQVSAFQINYKMGRASEETPTFSIEGREIDREFSSENNENRDVAGQKNSKTQVAKKSNATVSGTQTAKNQNSVPAQKNTLPKAQVNENAVYPKPVNLANLQQSFPQQISNGVSYVQPQEAETSASPDEENKIIKKSLEQILTEFASQADKNTILRIVGYYKKNEVSQSDFYNFVKTILTQNEQKNIGLALFALRLTPSFESFQLLALSQNQTQETYQSYIEEALMSYNQNQNIGFLNSALKGSSKVVALKAADIARAGLTQIKSGDVSSLLENRQRRQLNQSQFSLSNYLFLVATLENLMQTSQDSDLKNAFSGLRDLIKDSNQQVATNP